MTVTFDLLIVIIIIVILIYIIISQRSALELSKKEYDNRIEKDESEKDVILKVYESLNEALNNNEDEKDYLRRVHKILSSKVTGSGSAILNCVDGVLYGCSIIGSFPPLKEVSRQIERELVSHDLEHTEFINNKRMNFTIDDLLDYCENKTFAFFYKQVPPWLPKNFKNYVDSMLMVPILKGKEIFGCYILITDDLEKKKFGMKEGEFLGRITEIIAMNISVLRLMKEKYKRQENIFSAREENMSQLSTGIIHNIGNAITVAKLSVVELREKIVKKDERPENLILNEILPKIKDNLKKGNIEKFLTSDSIGKQYLEIMSELLQHVSDTFDDSKRIIRSLTDKMFHISEIIELQQRFVGELGTVSMTKIPNILNSSIKIFEETCNKKDVEIRKSIDEKVPEINVDRSMMTQVFMNIIKNAVEAMEGEQDSDKKHFIEITVDKEKIDEKEFVLVVIKDNGPGIPEDIRNKIFDFGFSTKGKENSRGYGLHSCVETVRKFGGKIEIDSKIGEGSSFQIYIPGSSE